MSPIKWILGVTALAVLAMGGVAVILDAGASEPAGGDTVTTAQGIDLSNYSDAAPGEPLHLVFLHHSVGSHLLAEPGSGGGGFGEPHPNGGGLRKLLQAQNYRVHEATYGSVLGEHTDLFDWLPKFRDHMDQVLRIERQDTRLPEGQRNRVVLFKSCFPNNEFVGRGTPPGDPGGPALTLENARATMRALRPELAKRPDTLFVYLTAPPVAPNAWDEPTWKRLVKRLLGKPSSTQKLQQAGALAREFNNWMKSDDGWLSGYDGTNIVVFDYYDVLTGGVSNLSHYPTGARRDDSHPSSEGNQKAARLLVPFLNRAVHRAGLAGVEPDQREAVLEPAVQQGEP